MGTFERLIQEIELKAILVSRHIHISASFVMEF